MTYFVSLKIVTIIVGLLIALAHLPLALAPERSAAVMRTLPRNYPLGVVLMLLATLWFTTLTGVMDLGEISSARMQLMAVWMIAGGSPARSPARSGEILGSAGSAPSGR